MKKNTLIFSVVVMFNSTLLHAQNMLYLGAHGFKPIIPDKYSAVTSNIGFGFSFGSVQKVSERFEAVYEIQYNNLTMGLEHAYFHNSSNNTITKREISINNHFLGINASVNLGIVPEKLFVSFGLQGHANIIGSDKRSVSQRLLSEVTNQRIVVSKSPIDLKSTNSILYYEERPDEYLVGVIEVPLFMVGAEIGAGYIFNDFFQLKASYQHFFPSYFLTEYSSNSIINYSISGIRISAAFRLTKSYYKSRF